MSKTTPHSVRHTFVLAAAVLLAACANDAPAGPSQRLAALAATPAAAAVGPDLGSCDYLAPPTGSELLFHAYAEGEQIYRWDGSSWVFNRPLATLYADSEGQAAVGTHSAGPTWQSVSGSRVIAKVSDRCTPNADAIQWLKLDATFTDGSGVFRGVTHIQRVNTVGGLAPVVTGSTVGEEKGTPYTAEYYFYRAR